MSMGGSHSKTKKDQDKDRKWMWRLLGTIAALQLYFVQELLAAFALFVMAFLAIAGAMVSLYMMQRGWALTVDRVADSQIPAVFGVRHGILRVEDLTGRAFRSPGSGQPAN